MPTKSSNITAIKSQKPRATKVKPGAKKGRTYRPMKHSAEVYRFIECRNIRHPWFTFHPLDFYDTAPQGWWWLHLRCGRCGAERHDLNNPLGVVEKRKYKYPKGYSWTRDQRIPFATLRVELGHRLHEHGSEDELLNKILSERTLEPV